MIVKIMSDDMLLAIIVKHSYQNNGIEFFTPDDFSQQLAYMNRPKNYVIEPHIHNLVMRNVSYTQEVLIVKRGVIRIDFYNEKKEYIESRIVKQGDIVLLAHGGHGIEMVEDSEIIEVKQGPYVGELDKVRFSPVDKKMINLQE